MSNIAIKKLLLITALLFCFSLVKAQHTDERSAAKTDTAEQFLPVEKIPQFPGGFGKLTKYLEKNRKKNIKGTGRVFVTFVIEKDGSLSDIKVRKGLSPEADAEAIRLMAECPNWEPGMQNNRPVSVRYNMPIKFE